MSGELFANDEAAKLPLLVAATRMRHALRAALDVLREKPERANTRKAVEKAIALSVDDALLRDHVARRIEMAAESVRRGALPLNASELLWYRDTLRVADHYRKHGVLP